MKSLQGQLLIASNELRDPNFFRTAVLIFRHEDDELQKGLTSS